MALPIKNGKITTAYKKPGKMWSKGYHTGVDFAVPTGTPVLAVADGKIENANWGKSYGNQVVEKCDGGWVIYAHLNAVRVKPGATVTKARSLASPGTQETRQAHTCILKCATTSVGQQVKTSTRKRF